MFVALAHYLYMSGFSFLRRGGDAEGWRSSFNNQLERLTRLPGGRDSWTAHAPKRELLDTARAIADSAADVGPYFSFITATSEGGIQIKWQNSKAEFSIFLYPNDPAEFVFLAHDRHTRQTGEVTDPYRAGKIVSDRLKSL